MSALSTRRAGETLGCLLLFLLTCIAGCGPSGQSVGDNVKDVTPPQPQAPQFAIDPPVFEYVVTADADFYREVPREWNTAPDGELKAGTPVAVKRLGDRYLLLEGEDGQVVHIAVGKIKRRGDDLPTINLDADTASLVKGNSRFALDLYRRLASEQKGNLFFSPHSIATALAMTYAGARGETAAAMRAAMHIELSDERFPSACKTLGAVLRSDATAGYQLQFANRLFGQQGYGFRDEFLASVRENFGTKLLEVDFAGRAADARREINAWVEKQTQGKIRDLVPPEALDGDTRLALVNAIYFQAVWRSVFEKRHTEKERFHRAPSDEFDVPMMYQHEHLRFRQGSGWQALELPYGPQARLSMIVVLPEAVDGLPRLEAALTSDEYSEWTDKLSRTEVFVHLPKFRTTSQFRLDDVLKALGMKSLFTLGEADLSAMNGNRELFVSAVLHKAYIDVDEAGTEAAAATEVEAKKSDDSKAPPKPPPVFRADHPFLFVIRDNRSGSILFMGRVVDPR